MKNKTKSILVILFYIGFVIAVWYYISSFLVDKESIRNIINGFGVLAPLGFIILQIIQNIFAPIAHYPILLAGGFIFGPVLGFIYNWIGTTIGTMLIIFLTKKFGRPLVEKMVKPSFIQKYDKAIKKLSPYGLFLIYALPVFPDDEITYLIGLSAMPTKSILFAIILGKIPGAALSFMGDEVVDGMGPTAKIQIAVLIIGSVYYLLRKIIIVQKTKIIDVSNHPSQKKI